MRLQTLITSVLALMLVGGSCIEAIAQTQALPSASTPIVSLERYLLETSKQPKYDALDAREKRLLVMLATLAATMVDSGRCADASAAGSAAEASIFSIGIWLRRAPTPLQVPIRTELVELAMNMESNRPMQHDLTDALCRGRIVSASNTKSLTERRARAREVLILGLSPPQSATATSPH